MRGRWRILLAPLACALIGSGCLGESSTPEGLDCVDDHEFFQKEVWSAFMGSQCTACHRAGGQADGTDLVLQPEEQTGFIDANFQIVREVASYHKDGVSVLLRKPLGELGHEGGVQLQEDSAEYRALVELVERFENPSTCDSSRAVEEKFDGVVLLSPEETLRKASLNLTGRLPTAAQEFEVVTGGEEALDGELDRLMAEPAFLERVEVIFNDMFLVERYLGRDNAVDLLDSDYYPRADWYEQDEEDPRDFSDVNQDFLEGARAYTNDAVARAPLKLASWLVANNRPFTEIVTADYMVVNPYSAAAYGIEDIAWEDPLDPEEWRTGAIPGHPHAGVLSDPMWHNRFPTTPTNRNRHRARMVYWFFLATDVMKLAERPIDPTNIESHNPTMNNPNCSVCHQVIDPVAGLMQNWDESGSYAPPADGWYPEMVEPAYSDETRPSDIGKAVQFLGQKIAADPRFATSMVHHVYRGLTGQQPLSFPKNPDDPNYAKQLLQFEVQEAVFKEVAEAFVASDFNLKAIFKALILSPYFRAANHQDEARAAELTELGPARMLTPELLNEKIRAVTGQYWSDGDGDAYLLDDDEYMLLYGGIDSDDVTARMTEPNGIMTGVQYRMANEMACRVTALDFTSPKQERRLFPYVELDFLPTANGFAVPEVEAAIRKNIQYLHWHVLGERRELDDPEIDRTYELFMATLEEGQAKLAAGELDGWLRCRAEHDAAGVELSEEDAITDDPNYTVRAWMAVVTYLLADYAFLYE